MLPTILIAACLLAFLSMLGLNTAWIPTPQDEALRIEPDGTTKVATFAGTTFDQGAGFAPGGIGMPMAAVVKPTAVDRADGNETYTFTLTESADNATFTPAGVPVVLTTNAINAFTVPGFISQRYVRLAVAIAGTTPSITYGAWLNANVSM